MAQIDMYVGKDAEQEAAIAQAGGKTRIDSKTGHHIVSCDSNAEAAELLQSLRKKT